MTQSELMTKLLDKAVAAARDLPVDLQDDIARIVLELVGQSNEIVGLTSAEQAAITSSKAAAAQGDFATHGRVLAVWAKHGF